MLVRYCRAGAVLLALYLIVSPLAADQLPAPEGAAVLYVDGSIENTNEGSDAVFDLQMLKDLGAVSLTTSTKWTEGTNTFEGIPVSRVLEAVGAQGTTVVASALDDYSSEIPISDFNKYQVILAYSMDGTRLSRRDKGPLWIMYPWDDHPELYKQDKILHAVWQLKRLTVK